MTRRNPLAAIEARQRAEEAQRHMTQTAAENSKMKMMGRWEQSSAKRVAATEYYRDMDRIQAREDDVLVARRERLAAMLLREKEEHDAMIAGLAETDEQRRDRLMQQARDLRVQRDEHRRGQSDMRMAQLALEKSAAVRQATSSLKVLQVADARQQQLEDNQRRREQQAEEDRFFTEQWIENQKAQNARARADLERKYTQAKQNQADLAVQVTHNQLRKVESRERAHKEDEEFFRLLGEEQRAEMAKQEARRQHRIELADEMKAHNAEIQRIRREEYEQLRAEDKALLDEILHEMQERERNEAIDKRRRRDEAVGHMRKVEAQMNEQAESETALDKLWQEENDREWAKREAKWMADQDRRERLLRAVYEVRRQQVMDNRDGDARADEAKRQEHEDMVNTVQRMRDEDFAAYQSRRAKHAEVQNYLSRQIETRENERRSERENKQTELTDAQRYESFMEGQIASELKRLDSARPERYRGVPLRKTKAGLAGLENF